MESTIYGVWKNRRRKYKMILGIDNYNSFSYNLVYNKKMMERKFYKHIKQLMQSPHHRFHMPGHKGKNMGMDDWNDLDITELPDTDNLNKPEAELLELEETIAKIYGAKRSHILVGGSTLGNLAGILGATQKGDQILVPLNCHKSIYSALTVAQVEGIFIMPESNPYIGEATTISVDTVVKALEENPNVVGMVMTNPAYNGAMSDLEAIARVLHKDGKWLMVDEAHGAHLVFSELMPQSALEQGADLVVQSAHKTLMAPTQTALIHFGSDRISIKKVENFLTMLQSSSPSYPLIFGVEAGVAHGVNYGESVLKILANNWDARFKQDQETTPPIRMICTSEDAQQYDKTKWVFYVENGMGMEIEKRLRKKDNLWLEYARPHMLMAYMGMGTTQEDMDYLLLTIDKLNGNIKERTSVTIKESFAYNRVPQLAMDTGTALQMDSTQSIKIEDSVGQISANFVIPYPPGIPALLPGEIISLAVAKALQKSWSKGEEIVGMTQDGRIEILEEKDQIKQRKKI